MSSVSRIVWQAIEDVVVISAIATATVAVGAICGARLSAARAQPPTRIVVPVPASDVPRPDPAVLRVCADPNNLPFTNERREGMENAIAELVARDLGKRLDYYWQPQRRGFIRTTLKAGRCDVVMGVPSNFELASPTIPYYRSTYVFVSRRDRLPQLRSFDDPRLAGATIGIQITGEDYENPPPAHALAVRHLYDNVRGYTVYGDYSRPDPQRHIIDAVAAGEVDTAVVWGPFAQFFARQERVPLEIEPVTPARDSRSVPFVFDIAMGVRKTDQPLRDALNATIARRRLEIRRILRRFSVPLVND